MDAVSSVLERTSTFILAGGQGERLHPLTVSRPKPAVSFGGVFRIVDFTLFNCLQSGLGRVSLLTQYKYEELHRYIREDWSGLWSRTPGCQQPLLCLPPVSGKRYRGTADAIFQNISLINVVSDFVLVLSGDHVYEMDYWDLLRQHIETNAELTIAAVEYPLRKASYFGVIRVDETSKIKAFDEKPANPYPLPANPSMALVSMGVYVFSKSLLLSALDVICGSGQGFDFGHDVIPTLVRSTRTYAYEFRDRTQALPRYWRDIGTIDAYYAANMDVIRADPPFNPHENGIWSPRPPRHPPIKDAISTRLHRSQVDSRAQVNGSVLSPGVRVEKNATVSDSVLMPDVRVGHGTQLRRAVVEEGVHLPDGFCAGFDVDHDRNHHTVSEGGVVVIAGEPVNGCSRRVVNNLFMSA